MKEDDNNSWSPPSYGEVPWGPNGLKDFGKFESDELEAAKALAGLPFPLIPLNISSDISLTRSRKSRANIRERLLHLRDEARLRRFGLFSLLLHRLRHSSLVAIFCAAVVIYFILSVLSFTPQEKNLSRGVTSVACPSGYAIRIPPEEENAGSLLPCEDFDIYYQSIEGGERTKAQSFLFR